MAQFIIAALALSGLGAAEAAGNEPAILAARVVAVGIPGAGAVSAVGAFHAGGPIHDKPALAALTQAGRVLDPSRMLVTSSSNFSAPLARAGEPGGSVLSLAPDGELIVLAPDVAAAPAGGRDAAAAMFRRCLGMAASR